MLLLHKPSVPAKIYVILITTYLAKATFLFYNQLKLIYQMRWEAIQISQIDIR